jgi:TPR repeat protein
MRKAILLLTLLAPAAWAGGDNQEMNSISKLWDGYALASSSAKPTVVSMMSRASLAHYAFLRDAALYASTEQMRRVPLADRVLVYALRANQDQAQLSALDGAGVVRLCTTGKWCGVSDVGEGEALPTLSHVTLIDPDRAIGEFGPPTGTQYLFGPEFIREDGQWKVMPESLAADESATIDQQIKRSGLTENQMLERILASLLGEERPAPSLVTLERPLTDDAGARMRLNEAWPRYQETYKTRVKALAQKSDQGDAFAQFALGSTLVLGNLPQIAPKDEARGWKLLEQASEGGNSAAAWSVFGHLMSDRAQYSDAQFRRALTHLQRAANADNPAAMAAMGSFYFEGVGGLQRDCRQAADWQARAEEAGVEHARNEQVWTLATCPIAEQRDPAKALQLASFMISNKDTLAASELDTVAAAYAANRKFTEAATFQQLALDKLGAGTGEITGKKAVEATRKRMQTRLRGYQRGQDYVQDYSTLEEIAAGRY